MDNILKDKKDKIKIKLNIDEAVTLMQVSNIIMGLKIRMPDLVSDIDFRLLLQATCSIILSDERLVKRVTREGKEAEKWLREMIQARASMDTGNQ